MKKFITILALMSFLFTSNSADAKDKKAPEPVTAPKSIILKKVYTINKQTYKNTYKYDENGNMINKITFLKEDGFWKPVSAYSIHYGENENTVTFALWDAQHKTFTLNAKQNKYDNKDFISVIDTINYNFAKLAASCCLRNKNNQKLPKNLFKKIFI